MWKLLFRRQWNVCTLIHRYLMTSIDVGNLSYARTQVGMELSKDKLKHNYRELFFFSLIDNRGPGEIKYNIYILTGKKEKKNFRFSAIFMHFSSFRSFLFAPLNCFETFGINELISTRIQHLYLTISFDKTRLNIIGFETTCSLNIGPCWNRSNRNDTSLVCSSFLNKALEELFNSRYRPRTRNIINGSP